MSRKDGRLTCGSVLNDDGLSGEVRPAGNEIEIHIGLEGPSRKGPTSTSSPTFIISIANLNMRIRGRWIASHAGCASSPGW